MLDAGGGRLAGMDDDKLAKSERRAPAAIRYPEWVKDLAKLVFFDSDLDFAATHRRLVEELAGDPDWSEVPSLQTLRYWSRTEAWPAQLDALLADQWPQVTARQLARLFMLGNDALTVLGRVQRGEMTELSPGHVASIVAAASKVLDLRGLGTAGMRTEGVKLAPMRPASAIAAPATAQEAAEAQRRIVEGDG